MDILQILFQVFVMFASAWFCFAASRHSVDAERSADAVRHLRAKILSMDAALESLESQVKKVSGRVYSVKQELATFMDGGEDDETASTERSQNMTLPLDPQITCEQWAIAQRDGPTSPAAKCECAYCTMRRTMRDRARNLLVPKTVQGQAEMAKVNAGKP